MKRILAFLPLIVLCSFLTSCAVGTRIGSQTHLDLNIFQTLPGAGAALAETSSGDIILLRSDRELLYDGRRIRGQFVLYDTYTYETVNGDVKTVPSYMPLSEYESRQKTKSPTTAL